ncbi:hypothetical protein [Patulibacter defluvii]|uniref:hypothetical protein n=1 Tax=Patulibacter defluvii TaxID=3095358 RepID=UPI002A74B8D6|nr:hypothetical protein [Patulibacter sp. DM4]
MQRVPSPARGPFPGRRPTVVVLIAMAALLAPAASATAADGRCDEIRWELRNKFNPFTDDLGLIRIPVCYRNGKRVPSPGTTRPKERKATKRQLRLLRFAPSDAVSRRVQERVTAAYVGDDQGPQADRARAQIASGDLVSQFRKSLREQRWSTRDAGDYHALGYIVCWLGVNGKRKVSDRVAEAVRKDLKNDLALDTAFRRSGDRAQQENAEWIASNVLVLAANLQRAEREGRTADADALRDLLRERARDADLFSTDLRRVTLTSRGVRRR